MVSLRVQSRLCEDTHFRVEEISPGSPMLKYPMKRGPGGGLEHRNITWASRRSPRFGPLRAGTALVQHQIPNVPVWEEAGSPCPSECPDWA